MTRARTAFLTLTLFAGGAGLVAQGGTPAQPAAETAMPKGVQGLTVGVVDFSRVFDAYPRAIDERKKLGEWRERQQAMIDAEERKLQEIRMKRDDLRPDTMERDVKELELNSKIRELEGLRQVLERDLNRRLNEMFVGLYADAEQAVGIVARERGVHLVLRKHLEAEDVKSQDARLRLYETRVVWFAAEEVDLTAAVIRVLQAPLPPRADGAGTQDPQKQPQTPTTGG
ncbi:MAG: OmpH family outer membrane protein [Planctomycetota bacterium]